MKTNMQTALERITHARDYHAENGIYPPEYEIECFDDWAADIADAAIQADKDEEARKEEQLEGARRQASAQVDSINGLVAALICDYDRLDELRAERDGINYDIGMSAQDSAEREMLHADLRKWEAENADELAELEAATGDCKSEDEARERITEDALDIQVRSGWRRPGETAEPEEFQILLCTGGPAVRIVGELDQYNQPCRAWVEYQDWFTPWTEYHGDNVRHDDLLTYCQQFYFGE